MEQTDINVQQLFSYQAMDEISTYQASKKVPRKLSLSSQTVQVQE